MCFKSPKPPPVKDPTADPELFRQRQEAESNLADTRAYNKNVRTEHGIALLAGKYGRRSLFSGGQGGEGFGNLMRRSLLPPALEQVAPPASMQVSAPQPVQPIQPVQPASNIGTGSAPAGVFSVVGGGVGRGGGRSLMETYQ